MAAMTPANFGVLYSYGTKNRECQHADESKGDERYILLAILFRYIMPRCTTDLALRRTDAARFQAEKLQVLE